MDTLSTQEPPLFALLAASIDPIVVMDEQARCLSFNASAERVFGISRDEAVGQDVLERLAAPDVRGQLRERLLELVKDPLARGGRFETEGIRADGTRIPVDVAFSAADVEGGRLFVAYIRDLSRMKQAVEAARASQEQLEVILRNIEDGITVQDRSGGLLYANDRAAELVGVGTAEELVSLPTSEILERFEVIDGKGDPFPLDQLPGRLALSTGETQTQLVGYRIRGSGELKWSQVTSSPIFAPSGSVSAVINAFRDVTDELRQAEQRDLIVEANRVLGASLDIGTTLEALADVLVPRLGDWSSIVLLEEDRLKPAALAHPDPRRRQEAMQIRDSLNRDEARGVLAFKVVEEGKPLLLPRLDEATLSQFPERIAHLVRELDLASALSVPCRLGDRMIGVITLARTSRNRPFDDGDLQVAVEIADRAALAIDNARLFREQQSLASALQASLLPQVLPSIPGIRIASRYRALGRRVEVGGDFYDVVPLGEQRWAVFLGDVEGKGTAAAASVGLARHTLRAAAWEDPSPGHVLIALNHALLQQEPVGLCTIAYGVISRREGECRLELALAGHPPPVLLAGSALEPLGTPSPPLGAFENIEVQTVGLELETGARVLFYSDGIALPHLASPESIELLVSAQKGVEMEMMLDLVLDDLVASYPEGLRDDVSMLALERQD